MASGLRKMAVYLGLVEDSSYDEYDEYEDSRSRRRGFADDYSDDYSERESKDRGYSETDDRYSSRSVRTVSEPRGAVRTFRAEDAEPRRSGAPHRSVDLSRIETVHPRTYNDARRIGEEFRDGVPVIMNLGEMDDQDAKRIIDFAAGLVFGVRGSIERITNKVFLLSPVNVDVGDQARAQVAQDDFFNQS